MATDEVVREEVLRIAAAVDREVDHAPDVVAATEIWNSAPVVLIDTDTLVYQESGLPRRTWTILVCYGSPAGEVWERAFTSGVHQVIVLPDAEADLVSALADRVDDAPDSRGSVLAVIGARGGAGSSVLASAVASRAARAGTSALLMDCDPIGGGIDLLFGAERRDGLRWPGLLVNSGRVSMADLHAALPTAGSADAELSILSCGRDGAGPVPGAVRSVIDAGRRSGEVVVCDLDRAMGPAARVAAREADLVLLVAPAEVRACAAGLRIVERLEGHIDRAVLQLVVRAPGPDGLYGVDVSQALDVPLLATLRSDRGLARALERGEFRGRTRGPLAGVANTVLGELASRSAMVSAR